MSEQQDFRAETDDVEGHRLLAKVSPSDEDDVEGHRLAAKVSPSDEDDVEGHRIAYGSAVQPGYDDDDVSGHLHR